VAAEIEPTLPRKWPQVFNLRCLRVASVRRLCDPDACDPRVV